MQHNRYETIKKKMEAIDNKRVRCSHCDTVMLKKCYTDHLKTKKHNDAVGSPITDYWIYKLVCKDPDVIDIYVGRTSSTRRRFIAHTKRSKTSNYPLYQKIRHTGGIDNWELKIIKKCYSYEESINEELKEIARYNPSLNVEGKTISNTKRAIEFRNHRKRQKELGIDKIQCECGVSIVSYNSSRHRKSLKHEKRMESINNK